MSLASRFHRSLFRKLLRSWLIQGIGWYAMDEIVARVVLEGGVILLLILLGARPELVIAGWLVFHTAAWLVLYGGFLRIWILREVETDVARLRAYRDEVVRRAAWQPFARVVFLRGSGGRDDIRATSDIDICVVPEDSLRARLWGILYWWALRAESVFRFLPLEARWIDAERYIPYHVIEETPFFVKRPDRKMAFDAGLGAQGVLITLSGIDGSGKTTAAEGLVSRLRAAGYSAIYFYGHRQGWYRREDGNEFSWAILFESLWRRVGGKLDQLERHPWAKLVYDVSTFLDYVGVQLRLSSVLRPGTVVVTDRYVADVIAYLRVRGTLRVTVEGLLVAVSRAPDVGVLLEIGATKALQRKREWKLPRLEQFIAAYADLKTLLGLATVDAGTPPREVLSQIERVLGEATGIRLPQPT